MQVAVSITEAVAKTPEDEEALMIARQLGEILRPYASDWLSNVGRGARPSRARLGEMLRVVLPKANELAPGVRGALGRLSQLLLQRARARTGRIGSQNGRAGPQRSRGGQEGTTAAAREEGFGRGRGGGGEGRGSKTFVR